MPFGARPRLRTYSLPSADEVSRGYEWATICLALSTRVSRTSRCDLTICAGPRTPRSREKRARDTEGPGEVPETGVRKLHSKPICMNFLGVGSSVCGRGVTSFRCLQSPDRPFIRLLAPQTSVREGYWKFQEAWVKVTKSRWFPFGRRSERSRLRLVMSTLSLACPMRVGSSQEFLSHAASFAITHA